MVPPFFLPLGLSSIFFLRWFLIHTKSLYRRLTCRWLSLYSGKDVWWNGGTSDRARHARYLSSLPHLHMMVVTLAQPVMEVWDTYVGGEEVRGMGLLAAHLVCDL